MKQVKSFIVEGSTVTRDGRKQKDIAQRTDEALNTFLQNLEGELVDLKITPQFMGASGDYAFVTVIYESKEAAKPSKK